MKKSIFIPTVVWGPTSIQMQARPAGWKAERRLRGDRYEMYTVYVGGSL